MSVVVPREKYPEMDWRAVDKVATWKVFKHHMKVIFVADQVPEERQYALILVAGGDKAFNHWNTCSGRKGGAQFLGTTPQYEEGSITLQYYLTVK